MSDGVHKQIDILLSFSWIYYKLVVIIVCKMNEFCAVATAFIWYYCGLGIKNLLHVCRYPIVVSQRAY